jgi:hypothetical protein
VRGTSHNGGFDWGGRDTTPRLDAGFQPETDGHVSELASPKQPFGAGSQTTGSSRPKPEVRRIDAASPKLSFENVFAPTLQLT